ncbi:hypothetical protein SNEBB_003432 [Seison nebaliae]|nr:hypothetical protein SNEBB_003432 [Seison nebaliae]
MTTIMCQYNLMILLLFNLINVIFPYRIIHQNTQQILGSHQIRMRSQFPVIFYLSRSEKDEQIILQQHTINNEIRTFCKFPYEPIIRSSTSTPTRNATEFMRKIPIYQMAHFFWKTTLYLLICSHDNCQMVNLKNCKRMTINNYHQQTVNTHDGDGDGADDEMNDDEKPFNKNQKLLYYSAIGNSLTFSNRNNQLIGKYVNVRNVRSNRLQLYKINNSKFTLIQMNELRRSYEDSYNSIYHSETIYDIDIEKHEMKIRKLSVALKRIVLSTIYEFSYEGYRYRFVNLWKQSVCKNEEFCSAVLIRKHAQCPGKNRYTILVRLELKEKISSLPILLTSAKKMEDKIYFTFLFTRIHNNEYGSVLVAANFIKEIQKIAISSHNFSACRHQYPGNGERLLPSSNSIILSNSQTMSNVILSKLSVVQMKREKEKKKFTLLFVSTLNGIVLKFSEKLLELYDKDIIGIPKFSEDFFLMFPKIYFSNLYQIYSIELDSCSSKTNCNKCLYEKCWWNENENECLSPLTDVVNVNLQRSCSWARLITTKISSNHLDHFQLEYIVSDEKLRNESIDYCSVNLMGTNISINSSSVEKNICEFVGMNNEISFIHQPIIEGKVSVNQLNLNEKLWIIDCEKFVMCYDCINSSSFCSWNSLSGKCSMREKNEIDDGLLHTRTCLEWSTEISEDYTVLDGDNVRYLISLTGTTDFFHCDLFECYYQSITSNSGNYKFDKTCLSSSKTQIEMRCDSPTRYMKSGEIYRIHLLQTSNNQIVHSSQNTTFRLKTCEDYSDSCIRCMSERIGKKMNCVWCSSEKKCLHYRRCPVTGILKESCDVQHIDSIIPQYFVRGSIIDLEINGRDLPIDYSSINRIIIKGRLCEKTNKRKFIPYRRFYCKLQKEIPRYKGKSEIKLFDGKQMVFHGDEIDIEEVVPVLHNIQPNSGIVSGGVNISLYGKWLNCGKEIEIKFVNPFQEDMNNCDIIERNETNIICKTNYLPYSEEPYLMILTIDHIKIGSFPFYILDNPIIYHVEMANSILSGGIPIVVHGSHFENIQKSSMEFRLLSSNYHRLMTFYSPCNNSEQNNYYRCYTPDIPDSISHSSSDLIGNIRFHFDDYVYPPQSKQYHSHVRSLVEDNTKDISNLFLQIYSNPKVDDVECFGKFVRIRGNNFYGQGALTEKDYKIIANNAPCFIIKFSNDLIDCSLNGTYSRSLSNLQIQAVGWRYSTNSLRFSLIPTTVPITVTQNLRIGISEELKEKKSDRTTWILSSFLGLFFIAILLGSLLVRRRLIHEKKSQKNIENKMENFEMLVVNECKDAFVEMQMESSNNYSLVETNYNDYQQLSSITNQTNGINPANLQSNGCIDDMILLPPLNQLSTFSLKIFFPENILKEFRSLSFRSNQNENSNEKISPKNDERLERLREFIQNRLDGDDGHGGEMGVDSQNFIPKRSIATIYDLLMNDSFMKCLLNVLDNNMKMTVTDRIRCSTFIFVIYLTNLEKLLPIINRNLKEKIEENLENAKMLFRRNDSIVEKLIVNFCTILLYDHFRGKMAHALFLLHDSVRQVIWRGAIDELNGRSKYSLTLDNLLHQPIKTKRIFAQLKFIPSCLQSQLCIVNEKHIFSDDIHSNDDATSLYEHVNQIHRSSNSIVMITTGNNSKCSNISRTNLTKRATASDLYANINKSSDNSQSQHQQITSKIFSDTNPLNNKSKSKVISPNTSCLSDYGSDIISPQIELSNSSDKSSGFSSNCSSDNHGHIIRKSREFQENYFNKKIQLLNCDSVEQIKKKIFYFLYRGAKMNCQTSSYDIGMINLNSNDDSSIDSIDDRNGEKRLKETLQLLHRINYIEENLGQLDIKSKFNFSLKNHQNLRVTRNFLQKNRSLSFPSECPRGKCHLRSTNSTIPLINNSLDNLLLSTNRICSNSTSKFDKNSSMFWRRKKTLLNRLRNRWRNKQKSQSIPNAVYIDRQQTLHDSAIEKIAKSIRILKCDGKNSGEINILQDYLPKEWVDLKESENNSSIHLVLLPKLLADSIRSIQHNSLLSSPSPSSMKYRHSSLDSDGSHQSTRVIVASKRFINNEEMKQFTSSVIPITDNLLNKNQSSFSKQQRKQSKKFPQKASTSTLHKSTNLLNLNEMKVHLNRSDLLHNEQVSNTKIISEIYFNRLLTTKNALIPIIDHLFHCMIGINNYNKDTTTHSEEFVQFQSLPPLVIRYFFQLFNQLASNIELPSEIIRVWMSNCFSLRIWINVIKNPETLIRMENYGECDNNVSIISQAYMDAFSISDTKLNENSATNKLLFNKQSVRYRQLISTYYRYLESLNEIPENDILHICQEISENFRKELGNYESSNLISILCDILYHNFILPNAQQIRQTLREESIKFGPEYNEFNRLSKMFDQLNSIVNNEMVPEDELDEIVV